MAFLTASVLELASVFRKTDFKWNSIVFSEILNAEAMSLFVNPCETWKRISCSLFVRGEFLGASSTNDSANEFSAAAVRSRANPGRRPFACKRHSAEMRPISRMRSFLSSIYPHLGDLGRVYFTTAGSGFSHLAVILPRSTGSLAFPTMMDSPMSSSYESPLLDLASSVTRLSPKVQSAVQLGWGCGIFD